MYEFFIARRYMVPKRGRGFLSLITWISVGGVSLGVLALVVVLAVMNGFEKEVKSRIVGTNAHLFLLSYGAQGMENWRETLEVCRANDDVVAAAPFVFGKAMVSARTASDGIAVKGVDLRDAAQVTDILEYIESPAEGGGLEAGEAGLPGIILGVHVADNLSASVGDQVQLISPNVPKRSPFGYVPKVRNFRVAGVFRSGMYEFDSTFGFIALEEAQRFLSMEDAVTGIELRVRDMYHAPAVGEELLASLGGFPYRTRDWIEMNATLFSWMETEKLVMFVILGLIILVAAFNITGALIMLVMEKKRDIGILRSLGATASEVASIFVLEGAVIGSIGMALGTAGGLVLCHLLDRYQFIELPGDVYFIDTLPIDVQGLDILAVVGAVLVISVLATLYPAFKAARLDPVEAIRYEG